MCAEPRSAVEIQCCDNLDISVNSVPSEIQSSASLEITPLSETGLNECSETAPSRSVIQSESVQITVTNVTTVSNCESVEPPVDVIMLWVKARILIVKMWNLN